MRLRVSYLFVKRFAPPIEHTYSAEKCRISGLFRLLFSEFEVGNTYPMVCFGWIVDPLYVVWGEYEVSICSKRFMQM